MVAENVYYPFQFSHQTAMKIVGNVNATVNTAIWNNRQNIHTIPNILEWRNQNRRNPHSIRIVILQHRMRMNQQCS